MWITSTISNWLMHRGARTANWWPFHRWKDTRHSYDFHSINGAPKSLLLPHSKQRPRKWRRPRRRGFRLLLQCSLPLSHLPPLLHLKHPELLPFSSSSSRLRRRQRKWKDWWKALVSWYLDFRPEPESEKPKKKRIVLETLTIDWLHSSRRIAFNRLNSLINNYVC